MDYSVIHNLIDKCWSDTTKLQLNSTEHDELVNKDDDLFIASIIFSGDSPGSMTIAMSEDLAQKIAAKMFEIDEESVSFDDIQDSIGELVNVLAGNLKQDYFQNCELSKPLVFQGSNSMLTVLGADIIFQKVFALEDEEQVIVQVCQSV